jgi:hypothetical protein
LALATAKTSSGCGLWHSQLFHDGPLEDLGPPELEGCPLGLRIKVFVYHRHDKKVLAQMTKTTFLQYWFLTVKYHQNAVKNHLPDEKDSDNTEKKNQGENLNHFLNQFLSEVSGLTTLTV